MTTGGDGGLRALPETREVFVTVRGLEIRAVSRSGSTVPWTVEPIPPPDGCEPGSLKAHAAWAHEWSVDVLVGYRAGRVQDRVELWRVGPWGLRTERQLLRDKEGELVPPISRVVRQRGWDGTVVGGQRDCLLEFQSVSNSWVTTYRLRTDALRFLAPVVRELSQERQRVDVFISYKAEDTEQFATELNQYLTELGVTTWFAPEQMYFNYQEAILDRGIAHSDHFLVILSEHTFGSGSSGDPDSFHWEDDPQANEELVQEVEVERIRTDIARRRKEEKSRDQQTLLFLADLRQDAALPEELTSAMWHRHRPPRRSEDAALDLDTFAVTLARAIARDIRDLKELGA